MNNTFQRASSAAKRDRLVYYITPDKHTRSRASTRKVISRGRDVRYGFAFRITRRATFAAGAFLAMTRSLSLNCVALEPSMI